MIQEELWLALVLASLLLFSFLLYQQGRLSDKRQRSCNEQLFFMNCAGFALLYSGAMAVGDSSPAAFSIRIALPLILCLIFSYQARRRIISVALKSCVAAICIILSMSCTAQKIACSYAWWGSYMLPKDEKVFSLDLPAMAGIKVSANHKELYETVTAVIEDNTSEDAVIWGYPHIKIFNILTNRYNMDTFVPVLFYDVVSDVYVEKELELLKNHLPDVIVWEEIADCKEVHEELFRDGVPLRQREIEAFIQEIIPKTYTCLTVLDGISVYILNDSLSPSDPPQ